MKKGLQILSIIMVSMVSCGRLHADWITSPSWEMEKQKWRDKFKKTFSPKELIKITNKAFKDTVEEKYKKIQENWKNQKEDWKDTWQKFKAGLKTKKGDKTAPRQNKTLN